jgi:hypothetical protein
VAIGNESIVPSLMYDDRGRLTFEMEQNIGLVVLEHLSHKLDVHILNIDFLWLG